MTGRTCTMRLWKRLRTFSLLERLIGLVLVLVIPLNILLLLSFRLLTSSSVEAQLSSLEYAGAAAATAIEARIEQAIQLGEAVAKLEALRHGDIEGLRKEAERIHPDTSDGWIFLSDVDGQTLFSQIAEPGEVLTRRLAEGMKSAERAFSTARPVVSGARFVPIRGDWFATIDVPVFKDSIPFRVLTVSVRCSALSRILSAQRLPEGWLAAIIDEDGRFVARSRPETGMIGKPASDSWRDHKHRRDVALLQTADGDRVYTANVPLTRAPGWAVGVGVVEEQLEQAARKAAKWIVPLSIAVSITSAFLAVALARSIGQPLKDIGTRLPMLLDQGDDGMRSGIPEIKAVEDAIHLAGTARASALRKLSESERLVRLVMDNTLAFIGLLSPDGRVIYVNKPALAASGVTAEDVVGKFFWECFWWSHDAGQSRQIKEAVARAATGELVRFDAVARVAPDGRLPIAFMLSAVRDEAGKITLLVPSGFDISDRKRNEQKLELLMREVNHRSKNMLSIVQAIAGQTFTRDAKPLLKSFQNRIMGLSASQDLLVNNEWIGADLAELARKQVEHLSPLPAALQLSGPPLRVKPAAAQAIGMAFHELATNATKYGAFAVSNGVVKIVWLIDEASGNFIVRWTESGGPRVVPPRSFGFGYRVLTEVAKSSVNGDVELTFEPKGIRWTLTADVREIAA